MPVFENKQIRVLNVRISPGDTSLYHLHHTPSLFIFLSNTSTCTQLQGKSPTTTTLRSGRLLYENLAAPNTRIHRVWNSDTDTLHVIDVELLGKDSGVSQPPLNVPGLVLEIDTPWVRAYRLNLKIGERFSLKKNSSAFLLVALEPGSIEFVRNKKKGQLDMRKGEFMEIEKRQAFSIINTGKNDTEFVLAEIVTN